MSMSGLLLIMLAIGVIIAVIVSAAIIGVIFRHAIIPIFGGIFDAIRMLGRFVIELIVDIIRAAIAIIAAACALPAIVGALALGRWHAARRMTLWTGRRFTRVGRRLGSIVTRTAAAGGKGTPPARRRTTSKPGEFDGWHVVDRLTPGGSGAQLYVAVPREGAPEASPEKVVIKCFDLSSGSPLAQMVRESRALEGARTLGLVVAHGMDEQRFWYAMPYIPGPHMAEAVESLHEAGGGLDREALSRVLGWSRDLLASLRAFHAAGLWHKDVKPENIIVNDTGAHLVDLGLITPLASAMTLTTHGTEYFRDPELVRQALRGAKVAEIDGARFDVYSAGAVLYFMVEGTFPAHGSLSTFSKPCPDVVRWIIRRAMADYQQRYASASAMLADVAHCVDAPDPMAVRPADLPSFTGEDGHTSADPAPASSGAVGMRPNLEVTDWWTGKYRVLDAVPGAPMKRGAFNAARRAKVERAAAHQARRASRRRRVGSAAMGGFSFLVGAAVLTMAMVAGSWFINAPAGGPVTAATTSASLPVGSGQILVLNDQPGDVEYGQWLIARLDALGWQPVLDPTTEAVFRRSLGPEGTRAEDLASSARRAMDTLDLQAVAIVRPSDDDDGSSDIVLITDASSRAYHGVVADH